MADFNINEIIIDRVYQLHKFDFDGRRKWTATQVRDPNLEIGSETVYSTDAVGANIMAFDRSKTATFTFNNALMHLGIMAEQMGAEKVIASDAKKVSVTCIEVLAVDTGKVTLTHTPIEEVEGVPFKYVDYVDNNMNAIKTFELGSTAATQFSVSGKVVTLPTGAGLNDGDKIVVKYKYETAEGATIDDNADAFAEAGEFVIQAFCYNPCDKGNKKLLNIIFPNAKEDGNMSLTLNNELTHPVTINAMQDYCSADKRLFRIEAVGI